jgi:hypothetical protein
LVGETSGAPGRSLYVRLTGPESGKGAAGNFTDAATGEYGDLLDLIGLKRKMTSMREIMAEARAFLSLPQPEAPEATQRCRQPSPRGSAEAARRLFAISRPIGGTLAEIYLRRRGLDPAIIDVSGLKFHPRCYYREDGAPRRTFPALIAAVTDDARRLTGVHRTWLDPSAPARRRLFLLRAARWATSSAAACASAWPAPLKNPFWSRAKDSRPSRRCACPCRAYR